jgi:hypothetical protein
VFFRSTLGIPVIVVAAYFAGGLHLLATKRVDSHALRSIAGVISMYCNFTAYTLLRSPTSPRSGSRRRCSS